MSKNGHATCWWFEVNTGAKGSAVLYDTDCGNAFVGFIDVGKVKYCPFCNRKIVVY